MNCLINNNYIIGKYINLDSRTDRRDFIENNTKKYNLFSNIERCKAIECETGGIGCSLSHIKLLKELKEIDANFVMIIEDDLYIIDSNKYNEFENSFEQIKMSDDWDVILLTPRGLTIDDESIIMKENNFKRIKDSQTTTGYIIKKHMCDKFINNFTESVTNLLNTKNYSEYALDQYWKKMQTEYKFYYYSSIFAGQLPGWSDIEKRQVNYNQRFIDQEKY
jgi:GR25 family glycosyltransferase involved in LPS biosynthesis